MRVWEFAFLMVLASFLLAGSCIAGQSHAGAQCEARFNSMDSNNDGKVTLNEFQNNAIDRSKAEKVFHSRDSNGDGVVTKDEMCFAKGK